jgi:hypothetical protein
MAATIERAKATDPKELRKEIARLKRDLAARPTEKVVEERVERVEVPVLDDEHVERLEDAVEALGAAASKIITATHEVAAGLGKLKMRAPAPAPARQPAPAPAARAPAAPPPAVELDGDFRPSNSQQRILNALAALEVIGVTMAGKTQLALFSEASPKSSGYTNNLGALRSAGLIDYPAPATVGLTDVGRSYADSTAAPSTGDELQAYVRQLVGASKARLLDQLIAAYPDAIAKDELAELAGVSAKSSGYTNNLGSLRSLGLIDYPSPGYVAALPVLFLEAA